MRRDFEPKALRKAKETLQKHLTAVHQYKETNHTYQKELFRPTVWERIKRFFRR
jgi:hypothetical protein